MRNPKYIIKPEVGYYQPFGQPNPLVTVGKENENADPLTDEVAEELLKKIPELKGVVIIENPNYEKPSEAAKRVQAAKEAAEKAEKEAAEQAAKEQAEKERAEKEEAERLAAEEAAKKDQPPVDPKKDEAANQNAADAK